MPNHSEKGTQAVRLQKILSESGVCSRRHAEALISAGRVTVNGAVVTVMGFKVLPTDKVVVDGKPVQRERKLLFVFHKPRGVITTMHDPHARKSISDFAANLPVRVFPIGRLDFDVSGLLLLTNDGDFMERMLHPRFGVERVYAARVAAEITEERRKQMVKGVVLEDGKTARAESVRTLRGSPSLERLLGPLREGESYVELSCHEGRNHFVKNLLSAVGCPVSRLARTQFGQFKLGGLAIGVIREVRFPSTERTPSSSDRKPSERKSGTRRNDGESSQPKKVSKRRKAR